MENLLRDQIAIVTGGTAGIGRAIATKFVQQGAKVAIFGTNLDRGAEVENELRQLGGSDVAKFYQVNISSAQEVDLAIKKVLEDHLRVDILINNAGITRDQLLIKMSEEDWDNVLEVNVKSCYNTCRAVVRSMMKARKGSIVNISSVVGLIGNPGQTNYAASKAAMIGFSKALAKELSSRQIRVNCVAPGFIETRMTDEMTEEQKKAMLTMIPMGHLGAPEDIANAVLFLVSSMGGYITGQVLTVDGGIAM